jgi:mono/diheme cytochrome c family protein
VVAFASLLLWAGVGAALADAVFNQSRDPQLQQRASSGVILGASDGAHEKVFAYGGDARAEMSARTQAFPVSDPEMGDAQKGLDYAQKTCSGCHNVLRSGAASPNKQAPTFREIANTPGMTITALTVWSHTSHPTMPNLVIQPHDMDNLIAYILSLRER